MANIKFKNLTEDREFVIIDPRGNARPVGMKTQGNQFLKKMGGARKGWFMVLKKNALKARRAIEKAGGRTSDSKLQDTMFDLMYEGRLNEARLSSEQNKALDNMNDWLPKGKEEEYLEILNQERAPAMIKFLTRNANLGVLYKKYKVRGKRDMAALASVLMNEGKLNEATAKDTLANAVNALTKTFGGKKIDKRYVKDYLKSMEQMARKKPMDFVKDYGDFDVKDWIEDAEYNLQNEGEVNEGMTSLQKKVRDEIDGMAINHYANVQNEFGIEDDKQMHKFITGLSDSDAKKLLQQIKKKMFEGKLKENKMIKFKDILKEAAWDHTSGKALPTLEDVQKAYEAKKHLQEELPIEEGDNTQYSWGQINSALMKNGMSPKNILRFLSILKKI